MNFKIAVVGLAHSHGIGFLRSAVEIPGVTVAGFFDPKNREETEAASKEFDAPVYSSLDDLINNSGAGILLTAAINSDRADIVIRGIEAGMNIVADKPLVTRIEDLDRIEQALERNPEVKLHLMLTERYNPVLVTAKSLIDRGEVGEIVNIINMRPHRLKPKERPDWMFASAQYGGILNDLAVHDIDIATWLCGSPVDEVLASTVSNKRFTEYTDFYDNGQVMLRLKNGCIVFILESWLTPEQYPYHGEMKFIIHGTKGQIIADPQNNEVIFYSDEKPIQKVPVISPAENFVTDPLKYFTQTAYDATLKTNDGLEAQRVALICQEMAEKSRE